MIHVVLIATGKVVIDAIPGVTQNISWTAVNLCYLAVRSTPYFPETPPPGLPPAPTDTTAPQCSYLMFHWVTGIPFGSELHGGAYDDLTLWEQIDGGAQNTPSRKWLFSVPVGLCVSSSLLSLRCSHDHIPKTVSCSQHITRTTTHGFLRSTCQP